MRLSATNSSSTSCTRGLRSGGASGNTCVWTMRYHMYGNNNDWTFRVYVQQGTGASATNTLIHEVDGYPNGTMVNTSASDEWKEFTYDLMPSFAGQDVRILVMHSVGRYATDFDSGNVVNNVWQADTAIDNMSLTTNGVYSDYSGYNSTQRLKWRRGLNDESISIALARSFSPYAIPSPTHRSWSFINGSTWSPNTGPDKAFNNLDATEYIYFECSTSATITTVKHYPLRMTDTFSVPS